MPTETANYGFTKDNEDEFYNVNTVNVNLDKIDTEMKRIEDESKSFNQQVIDNTNAIVNANTKLNTHIKDDSGHVRFIGNSSGGDGMACRTDLAPVDLVNDKLVPRKGHAFRFLKEGGPNTGPATLVIVSDTLPGNPSSVSYQILNSKGQPLKGGELVKDGIYTLAFNGTAFILQGESGVSIGNRGIQIFNTPGSTIFTVPDGVTRIHAQLWGAGGGGGGANSANSKGGGGGGAGGFKEYLIRVTPGSKLTVNVGRGGDGGAFSSTSNVGASPGGAGLPSEVIGAASGNIVAWGGGSGLGATTASGSGGGGAGYVGQGATGAVVPPASVPINGAVLPLTNIGEGLNPILKVIVGGSGSYGSSYQGGGGGGAPSDTMYGTGGFNASPGSTFNGIYSFQNGGRGGNGAGTTPSELDGVYPGGGGAGGNSYTSAVYNGGKGAQGLVILAW